MKTFLRFNPSICSINIGDQIIVKSIIEEMDFLFKDNFCIDVSSHQPISWIYSERVLVNKDLSFVLGSNLLRGKLNGVDRQWDINIFNAKKLGPAVLIGTGWRAYNEEPNAYTKAVYKSILSKDYCHSVRDAYTEQMMRKMGFSKVINTGCATMWKFTPEFCAEIPTKKANNVITTITDYQTDIVADKKMIDVLSKNYETVYIWIQGMGDHSYISELVKQKNNIKFITPILEAYDNVLNSIDSLDYVGTRLHGGIRAIQKLKRALIIATDNRAKEKKKDFNLPVLERSEIDLLEDWINAEHETKISIPIDAIEEWKGQFVL